MAPCGEAKKALKNVKHVLNSMQAYNFPIPQCQAAQPKPALEQEEGCLLWPLSRPGSSCKDTPDDEEENTEKSACRKTVM